MATSLDSSSMEDVTLCSICFEKFKSPRFLPCTHSFCHGCLSSYIVNVCKSTEPRLGFNCPLCREYTPCPGAFDKSDEWAGLFPVNEVLETIVKKPDGKLCDACLRENESENAIGFCLSCSEYLCKMCTKYHKRQLHSRDHTICQLNEMKSENIFPESRNIHGCPEHKKETIKFFCNDHQQSCCSVCIGTKHRKCESVDTVEDAAKNIKENGQLDALLGDVKNLEKKLTKAKSEQEKNVAEIENSVDEIIEKTEREFKELVDHLEILKNKHLDEVAGALKKGRRKLSDCTNALTDGIQCTNYCCRNIERVKETENDAEMVTTYYREKERLLQLEQFKFTKINIAISEKKSQVLKEVRNMETFGDIEYAESDHRITYDVHDIALSLVSEFSIAGGSPSVQTGNFLSNGNFVAADYRTSGCCFIYNKDWKSMEVIDGLTHPFEAIQAGEELLVTCYETRSIEVFSASDLHKLRSVNINEYVFGITKHNGACYVACGNKILKIDMSGKKLKEYKVEWGTINISTTKHGHLVYSNPSLNTVTAITDQGDTVWQYKHIKMKEPRGLDIDSVGNIFVAATGSDNIHVLSGAGSLIRIIEDILQPVFIKLMEERSICCVCSNRKIMKVYKL
ncbi:tripartite motif-containing protein 45-like [Ostrea edulis]|uniref:tripartite motif-containing protein 45-like n=1 Tax=Ostrea edulis TaxID=37623 RepID=UPI0024AE949E|nr:tripartite motif-containing protein 45-like [Ostrea edulis]